MSTFKCVVKPEEAANSEYPCSVSFDPEDYDFSEYEEDEYDCGWDIFYRSFVESSTNLEDLTGVWDTFDAGSIFYGDFESCKRLFEALSKVEEEHGGFDLVFTVTDFATEIVLDSDRFQVEDENLVLLPFEGQAKLVVETREHNGETVAWILPGDLVFDESYILSVLAEEFPRHGFELNADWIIGDNCDGNLLEICSRQDMVINSLAQQVANACGLEVVVH